MEEKRRHKRFNVDLMEINGKMSLADKVEIIDISLGGVALKADRRLNMGKEYLITLADKGQSIKVKGVVVRSSLSGIEERADGEKVTIYTAGMIFKGDPSDKLADFLHSVKHDKKEEARSMVDRRLNIRFQIAAPGDKILNFPAQFKVKQISLSGMLIQAELALARESMIPMGLSFNADNPVKFTGRVASCRTVEDKGQAQYEIGVEFSDLTDRDRTSLATFIDYLAVMEVAAEKEKADD